MGVDCKGFVLTRNKDVFFYVRHIENALNRLIMQESGCRNIAELNRQPADAEGKLQWKTVETTFAYGGSRMLNMEFNFKGERRRLAVFFDCDCDQSEYGPASVSFSMGCWGSSEQLMRTVLEALTMLGKPYLDVNDSDDIDPAELPAERKTYLSACHEGSASSSNQCFSEWLSVYDSLAHNERPSLPDFMGLSLPCLEEVITLLESRGYDWKEVNAILDEAVAQSAATPLFA